MSRTAWSVGVLLAVVALDAAASEVILKIDSWVPGGPFRTLMSRPCQGEEIGTYHRILRKGTIVGVQVYWAEQDATQMAIKIYLAPYYPHELLARIDQPAMVANTLNEFPGFAYGTGVAAGDLDASAGVQGGTSGPRCFRAR